MAPSAIMNSYYRIHPYKDHNFILLLKTVLFVFSSSRCLAFI